MHALLFKKHLRLPHATKNIEKDPEIWKEHGSRFKKWGCIFLNPNIKPAYVNSSRCRLFW